MTEHLSPEEIERLSKYQLHGEELLDALAHVEGCLQCREKISSPSKAEIIEQLFDEKSSNRSHFNEETSKNENPSKDVNSGWLKRLKKRLSSKE